MTTSRTVAVTGLGMVTPLGNDVESTWNAILNGESGVREIAGFDASGFPTRIAAEVKDLRAEEIVEDRKSLKYVTPFSLFALAAAEEAVRDAGVRPTAATAERWGLVSGSGMMTMEFDFLQRFQREYAVDGQIDLARLGAEGTRFISSPSSHAIERLRARPCCTSVTISAATLPTCTRRALPAARRLAWRCAWSAAGKRTSYSLVVTTP